MCAITIVFFLGWKAAVATLIVFAAVLVLTRKVSLGSIFGAIVAPIFLWLFRVETSYIIFAVCIMLFVVFLHRSNIKRIFSGAEHEAWKKKT